MGKCFVDEKPHKSWFSKNIIYSQLRVEQEKSTLFFPFMMNRQTSIVATSLSVWRHGGSTWSFGLLAVET